MDLDSQRKAIQAIIDSKKDRIAEIKAEQTEPFRASPEEEPLILPEREEEEEPTHEHKKHKKHKE